MYQKVILTGNLGKEPELRYLPSGQAVTNFSMATNRSWTDSYGQKQDETTWFRVSVWGNQAEAVNQYLQQGSRVLVEGRLKPDPETGGPRVYERNDGTYGASFEVTANRVVFLSTKDEEYAPKVSTSDVEESDIPF